MPFYKINRSFLLFFLWYNFAFSQNYPGRNYTAANELPNNAVRSLLVDSNHILWIGTENGVVKKENDVFNYFFEEDGLALNSCWAIAEDPNKNLWFGSYGEGVSIYDGYKFKLISKKEGLVHNEITKLFSHQNYMYVGTSNGVSLIDVNNFKVISLTFPNNNKLFRVQDFFKYRNQIYVVTYNTGIYRISNEDEEAALVKVNDHQYIYSVLVDNDSIYSSNKGFFTKNSLADYVSENNFLPLKKLGYSIIWEHVKTNDDRIFAGAWGIYDSDGGIYELVNNQLVSRSSEFNVPGKEVISLAYDPGFGRLYIGTKDSGLFEIALNPQIKFVETQGENVLNFAKTDNTSALVLHDAIILKRAGWEQKITLLQLKQWQEKYVTNTTLPLPKHQDDFYELDYSIKAKEIRFYDIKVSENIFWVNTNIGIFAIKDTGQLDRYLPLHSEEINFTPAGSLIETNPYGGLRVYSNLEAFEYNHFRAEELNTPTMVVGSLRKNKKTYLLSIFSGLYVWENGEFKSYLKNGIWDEKKLKHITALGDNIAVSNEFGDVFIISDEASFEILEKIPRAEIQGNTISFLKQYGGTLIIGTEKGLTLYKDKRSVFLDKEQGLEQPLLNVTVNKNILSIGSNNGYYNIDINAVRDTTKLVHQVNLKEIFVNNKKISVELATLKDIDLPYNQNTVLLKYTTNAHPFPNKLQYQYRLNSKDNWSLPSSKPEIFLASLPIEDYEVDVKIYDESTGLNYTQHLVNMEILPPFWKTWWFALLVLGVMILTIFSVYRYQLLQTKNFEEQKRLIQKRFEETKMEALLAQMNPHFIFNAMNSIQYYIMDSDIDNATVFLGDFSKLIRLNLDHCTRATILLIEEIEYLQSYIRLENTRFNNAIDVKFETDPLIDLYEIEIPTMILQTFVENVFVHAFPPGVTQPTLKISFLLLKDGVLQCKIEDNGIGISNTSENKLHKSKGVILVKERLALLGYNVKKAVQIFSEKNEGTTVILQLQV
ncbi:histidine kinase [Antarcticibacterium sp. 1MA-6-2]|uniref:sensor histidine kinase n=1 Tax=Antarcticibacterium sp. 1MA-6-2 TaxID=2908210 RepID=UPI001F1B52AE|nr:histidine kinase [Antarcticibacterium sp. 1MA-6-2]UJH92320.1 histidine kinase [Antarcticibacterium sp. 1MA-6-2]